MDAQKDENPETSLTLCKSKSASLQIAKADIVKGIEAIGSDVDSWSSYVEDDFAFDYTPTPGANNRVLVKTLEGQPPATDGKESFWIEAQDSYYPVEVKGEVTSKSEAGDKSKAGGTASIVTPSEDGRYAPGANVSIKATSKPGYAFKKWTQSGGAPKGLGTATFANDEIAATTFTLPNDDQQWLPVFSDEYKYTLTAMFEPITNFTVKFDKNAKGATGTVADQSFVYGTAQSLTPNTFSYVGYTFVGWNTAADGSGTSYKDNESANIPATERVVTLYAQWKAASYNVTVTPEPEAGGTASANPTSATAGTTIKLSATPADGYQFAGWEVTAGDVTIANDSFVMPASDVVVTATFEKVPATYSISVVKPENGTVAADKTSSVEGETVTLTATPSAGFVLRAWDVKDASGKSISVVSGVSAQADGSDLASGDDARIGGEDAQVDGNLQADGTAPADNVNQTSSNNPSGITAQAEGDAAAVTGTFTMPASNVTASAAFEQPTPTTCTITFEKNAENATGTMDPQEVEKGVATSLNTNAFQLAGYTFKEWNTAADGSGTAYADVATVTATSDMTLYARWVANPTPVTYTINFEKNAEKATGTMTPQTVEAGTTVSLRANAFQLAGYTFKAWNTAADGSGTAYVDGANITAISDMTLYAYWTKNQEHTHKVAPKPDMGTSAKNTYTSRQNEITYTITQKVPSDATYMCVWSDLNETMYYTTKPENVVVKLSDGTTIETATKTINGQRLEVTVSDAAPIADKTINIVYSAKVRDDANLNPYLNTSRNIASIPYSSHVEFRYTDGCKNEAVSQSESIKISLGSSNSGNSSSSSNNTTTTRTSSTATPRTSGTLATTADLTSAAGAAVALGAGVFALAAGFARNRR